jgi:hypothetical protein
MGRLGWIAAFVYCAGAALRLARFNTNIDVVDKRFFQGLPSPAAAALCAGLVWLSDDLGIVRESTLRGVANLSDGFSKRNGGPSIWKYDEDFDDGHTVHAPIGRFRANGFGLHDVLGNVNELCREGYGLYDRPEREHDGLRPDTEAASKMIRGGSFVSLPVRLRSAARWDVTPSYRDFATGLRPARALDR